jgi:formylglycine-generating enzyme
MKSISEHSPSSCCAGGQRGAQVGQADYLETARQVLPASPDVRARLRQSLVEIPGGIYEMGTRISTYPSDLDSPRRKVKVSPFAIAPTTVTNAQFAQFVVDTQYRTVAEREGWSYVFHLLLDDPERWKTSPPGLPWWRRVDGASWSCPEGDGTTWLTRADHPVVHITWYDALAYANWAGLRLPYEAEWERAARGGHAKQKFPWGNALLPGRRHMMNIWQGDFPAQNTGEDGYLGTAPASAFAPNDYGLYNMTGNVWEWVWDRYGPRPKPGRLPEPNPIGPQSGLQRMQRGGSFLCHSSYCERYHVHSRTRNDPDSSTSNAGFRVVSDLIDLSPDALS